MAPQLSMHQDTPRHFHLINNLSTDGTYSLASGAEQNVLLSLLYMPTYQEFSCRLKDEKWMNVQVGDIIKLENNNFVTVSSVSPHPVHS